MKIGRVAKAVVAGVGAVVTVATAAVADSVLSVDEGTTLLVTAVEAAVTIWGVWRVPNKAEVE